MPTLPDIHIDMALTDYSSALFQDLGGSVASQAFSNRNVDQQSNRFHIYNAADLHRTDAQKRAPNTSSPRRDYGLATGRYDCDVWDVSYDVSEQERANQDAVLDAEQDAARLLVEDLIMTENREWATAAFATTIWGGTDQTGGTEFTQWDDAASTPIENLRGQNSDISANTGRSANKLVLGHDTWNSGLVDHPDLLDRIKHTQTGIVTQGLLANILDLDQVIVNSAIRNTAGEGLAETAAFQLGDSALLLHAPDTIGPKTATAGIRFNWSGLIGGGLIRTKRFESPQDDAMPRVESSMAFDHHVQTAALGRFFSDTIA